MYNFGSLYVFHEIDNWNFQIYILILKFGKIFIYTYIFFLFQSDHEYESAAEDSALEESDVELDKEINSPTSNNTVDPNEKDQQTSIDKVTKVLDEVKIVEDNLDVDEVLELHSDKGKKISESASRFAKVSILRVESFLLSNALNLREFKNI